MAEEEVKQEAARERVVAIKDAAGNLYLIPAQKLADGLVRESAKKAIEAEIASAATGTDFELVGTYEMATSVRRSAYAKPRATVFAVDMPTA